MKKVKLILINLVFIWIYGCEMKPEFNYDFPRVTTMEASDVSEKGAKLNAEMEYKGSEQIVARGFLWGTTNDFDSLKDSVSTEGESSSENFFHFVGYALPLGKKIYYCGFVKTGKYLVYGNIKSFESRGGNHSEIYQLNANHGLDGDSIQITGDFFTRDLKSYQVLFGDYTGKVISADKSKLMIILPVNYNKPGKVTLKIKIHDNWFNQGDFILDTLKIKEINKSSAAILTDLEVTFNTAIQVVDKLFIGKTPILIYYYKGKKLKFTIPAEAGLGENKISGIINKKEFSSNQPIILYSQWKRKKDCPETSINNVTNCAYSIYDKAYYYLPPQHGGTVNNVWQYNPAADGWLKMTSVSGGFRSNTFAFTINQKAYWGAGASYIINSDKFETYEYSPDKNILKIIPNVKPFFSSNPMAYELNSAFGVGIGENGYLFGGSVRDGGTSIPYFVYNQTNNSWKQINTCESVTGFKYWYGMTGFEIDGEIYIGTGYTDQGATSKFWKYNPAADHWSRIADFPWPERYFAVGIAINGKGYVGLGESTREKTTYYSDFHEYNPGTNTWKRVADFPGGGRSGSAATVVYNKAYIGFGNGKNDLWEFTP